eukprot:COSAG02_NODE_19463_length_880_cov_1.531370_2_plen_75_part_00
MYIQLSISQAAKQIRGRAYLEGAHEILIHCHNPSSIVKFATVVRSGEYRHELPFGEKLVTVLNDLQAGNRGQNH